MQKEGGPFLLYRKDGHCLHAGSAGKPVFFSEVKPLFLPLRIFILYIMKGIGSSDLGIFLSYITLVHI